MARKPKPEAAKLTKAVSFRLSAADHAAFMAKVEASGEKPGDYFRAAIVNDKTQIIARPNQGPQVTKEWARLAYLFSKASNNINQLAHRANADHLAGVVSEATYVRVVRELHALSDAMLLVIKNDH